MPPEEGFRKHLTCLSTRQSKLRLYCQFGDGGDQFERGVDDTRLDVITKSAGFTFEQDKTYEIIIREVP